MSALAFDPLPECPILDGNQVTLLPSGAAAIEAMFDAIAAARTHIHLEYYIFDDVRLGGRSLVNLLLAALARGVYVALIYDCVGCLRTPPSVLTQLAQAGARMVEFHPLKPWRRHFTWHLNDRDHRKILVVDGTAAFLGGVNLARVYENPASAGIAADPRQSFWHDCAVRIAGPATDWAQRVFLDSWTRYGGDTLPARPTEVADAGPYRLRIAASLPQERRRPYFRDLHAAVASAEAHILLTTGYFVPARRDWKMLADAARRGVRVELLLASHSDMPGTLHAARALYGRLLQAGVHIFEVNDALLHAKAVTIDGRWSAIGSSNFDRRSYSFNNEVDAVLLGEELARQVEDLLTGWRERASPVDLASWRHRPWTDRAQEHLARLWERYM